MATERQRDDHGRFHIDESELEQRRLQVVKLHVDGNGFRAIGAQLGISAAQAHADFRAVMDRTVAEANTSADHERRVSLERINRAMLPLMRMVDDGDLDAMDRLDKLEKRRAALLGLDAPAKSEVTATVGTVDPQSAAELVRKHFRQAPADALAAHGEAPGVPPDAPRE